MGSSETATLASPHACQSQSVGLLLLPQAGSVLSPAEDLAEEYMVGRCIYLVKSALSNGLVLVLYVVWQLYRKRLSSLASLGLYL